MARAAGLRLSVDGLDEMIRGTRNGERLLEQTMQDVLKGPIGDEILMNLRARMSDHSRTGATLAALGKEVLMGGGVEVGITNKDGGRQHPSSKRANFRSISTWLESGTRMHLIPTKGKGPMNIRGRWVSRASHPGTKRNNIMRNSLRVSQRDIEQTIAREFERRLGRPMLTKGA